MAEGAILSRRAVLRLGAEVRDTATDAGSMEEVAQRIVRLLYAGLRDPVTDAPLCALARLFKTHAYQHLPLSLQAFARGMAGHRPIAAETPCLTLLATAGDLPDWNSRHLSTGHQAIPLTSEEMVLRSPMIAQLLLQFGLEPRDVLAAHDNLLLPTRTDTYHIFHIPQAALSPHVPAQETFVLPYGIASVVGFGGPLASGELFAIVLFTKTPVSEETASLFSSIALSAKLALLSLAPTAVFNPEVSS